MKRKNILRWTLFALCVCLLCGLCACSLLNFGGSDGGSGGNKKSTITVILHVEGYKISDFVDENDKIIKKPSVDPVKEGYDFVMWCSDEECTKELEYGQKVTADLDIYPAWTIKILTVSFVNTIDDTVVTKKVNYNDTVTLSDRQAAGYDFTGWYTDEECTEEFASATKITTDLTLYSGWDPVRYDINYVTYGGTLSAGAPQKYTMIAATTLPGCEKEGYTFVGWYDNERKNGDPVTEIAKGNRGPKNFYAEYTCNIASVTPKYGSVRVTDDSVAFSVKYVQSTIDLTEYLSFSEGATYTITENGSSISAITLTENTGSESIDREYTLTVTSESGQTVKEYDLTIRQYTSAQICVTYYVGANVYYTSDDRQAGDLAEQVTDPDAEEGYVFEYWCTGSADGDEYDFGSLLEGDDLDLYAKFSPIVYNITYVLGFGNNDVNNTATYTVEDAVVFANAVSTNEEYTFDGWYNADYSEKIENTSGLNADLTVYARYKLINKSLKDFSARDEIDLTELNDYFVYAFYHRISELRVKVTGGTVGEHIGDYIATAKEAAKYVDGAEGYSMTQYPDYTADADGAWDMRENYFVTVTYKDAPSRVSGESNYSQVQPYVTHVSATGRAANFNDFAIEHVADTLEASDTEQLVYAVEHGYRPIPVANSAAERVYNAAKTVLRNIIDDNMSDYEKALAIYEYLDGAVSYDHDTFDRVVHGLINNNTAAEYYCFYLEGVFTYQIAVCDGYSKAFMLLTRMEGIRSFQVEGDALESGSGHAWNKVYLSVGGEDKAWYVVDATSGDTLVRFDINDAKEIMTHAYFLYSDEEMATRYETGDDEFSACVAEENGNYYEQTVFTWDGDEYNCVIAGDEQMSAYLSYLISCTPSDKTMRSMDILFDPGYTPFTYDAEDNTKVTGIKQSIINGVGTIINQYNFSWTSAAGTGCYTFLCSKK